MGFEASNCSTAQLRPVSNSALAMLRATGTPLSHTAMLPANSTVAVYVPESKLRSLPCLISLVPSYTSPNVSVIS